ncbi:MAG: SDR family oxidoreductase [Chloroflexi bacterium]|jgi:NAD(P)-dependent dehydrogenase (short-subunit alcohol dehydrogenase family)|nr:SDR family oxidoreductase [Chloroflexota bacterium]
MDNKVILITGKNHEMNISLAKNLVSQKIKVACCVYSQDLPLYLEFENKTDVQVFKCDFKNEDELMALERQVEENFGMVDSIIFTQNEQLQKSFLEIDEEEWDYVYHSALQDYFFLVKTFTQSMISKKKPCKVICISTTSSIIPRVNASCYSSAFAAQSLLDACLALELGKYDISFNSICINSKEQVHTYVKNGIRHNQVLTAFISIEQLTDIVLSLLLDPWNALTGKKIVLDSGEILGDLN